MIQIDVKNQEALSFSRLFSIALTGIKYRIFRSTVTVLVVCVAIAFLMNIISESFIRGKIKDSTTRQLADIRGAAIWATRLSVPGSVEDILSQVDRAETGGLAYSEAKNMGGFSEAEMKAFKARAHEVALYLNYFKNLSYSKRRSLVHNAVGMEIFDNLLAPGAMERFTGALANFKFMRFASSPEKFNDFMKDWPLVKERALRIQASRQRSIGLVSKSLEGKELITALLDMDGPFSAVITSAGFSLDRETAKKVAIQARRMVDSDIIAKSILSESVRKGVSSYFGIAQNAISTDFIFANFPDKEFASWYIKKMNESMPEAAHLTAQRLKELSKFNTHYNKLVTSERNGMDLESGFMGISERMWWLIIVSLLVCTVGICNAILMSVTERFREIATLKCLGALDTSIMTMFVMEAYLIGAVGGFAGALLGSLIGTCRMIAAFGTLTFSGIPVLKMIVFIIIATFLGILLAALASIYPSFKAARLAPMEAMRIE